MLGDEMKEANSRLSALVDGLTDWGIEHFVYVPSSHSAPVIRKLDSLGVPNVMANREEEAVGIAGGLALTGKKVAIIMQDNGFGNALTALATFAQAYHTGFPIFANTRGGLGEYNSMIHSISESAPDLLRKLGIRVEELEISDSPEIWRAGTLAAAKLSVIQRRPIVTLFESLHPGMETM
jgi:sulfopyruvate decarboxylase subunit alpha